MSNFCNAVFLSTVLVFGTTGATFAQETATPAETETAIESEAVETQSDGGEAAATEENKTDLSLGEEAQPEPVVGQLYVKEAVGDWLMRCVKGEEGTEDPCQMYQLMDDGEGSPVAEVSIFRLKDGGRAKAGATIVVPLETSLPQQITLSVDGGKARRYPYSFCSQVGCYARVGFTSEDIASFKRGNAATVTIVPALAPDQKVELVLSLTGFTAAYDNASIVEP
jgi:invasion protein IalB